MAVVTENKYEIVFQANGKKVIIVKDDIKVKTVKAISLAFAKLRDRHSIFTKYPIKEFEVEKKNEDTGEMEFVKEREAVEDWRLRVMLEMGADMERQTDETDEAFDLRLQSIHTQDHLAVQASELALDILKICGKTEITESDLEEAALEDLRQFCEVVLKKSAIPDSTGMFFPSRTEF